MPPQKETNHEVVDMTKQYGATGPQSGVFTYVHNDAPVSFSIVQSAVRMGLVKDEHDAHRVLYILGACAIAIAAFFFWFTHFNRVPPNVMRPAIDLSARSVVR